MKDICNHPPPEAQRWVWRRLMEVAPFQPATNFWRSIELPILADSLPSQGRGLDVGCGDGALTAILRELIAGAWELIGIDVSPAEIDLAKDSGVYRQVAVASADRIPLPNGCLDFVFANSVLEHIPKLLLTLSEIARCLKPNGLFVATVPSSAFHDCLKGPWWIHGRSRLDYLAETDKRLAHFHYWSASRWNSELKAVGLEVEAIRGYLSRDQVEHWEHWSNWTGGLAYRLGRRQHQPIEIQRRLGLRRAVPRSLRPLGSWMGWLLSSSNLYTHGDLSDISGCFLVKAQKKPE